MVDKVVLDISRLVERGRRSSPTGIDRVEFAYLSYFLNRPGTELSCVHVNKVGVRLFNRDEARGVLESTARNWNVFEHRPMSAKVCSRLERFLNWVPPRGSERDVPEPTVKESYFSFLGDLTKNMRSIFRSFFGRSQTGVYINVAHTNLQKLPLKRWLQRNRFDTIFMVYDLIPITHPEYCRPGHRDIHRMRMRAMTNFADKVLAISDKSRDVFNAFALAEGGRRPKVYTTWLGISSAFLKEKDVLESGSNRARYFVVVGTIEPRKNHLLLLNVWREIVQEHGKSAPKLLIIGRRGWENENIIDMIERCDVIRDHVLEVNDLCDQELAMLMAGSLGVLVPSFTEGFSLPVVEGVAVGVPVIASDIEVHHEVGGADVLYISPIDGLGWKSAILDLAQKPKQLNPNYGQCEHFASMTWKRHFETLESILTQ